MNHWYGKMTTRFPVVPLQEVASLGTGHTPSRDKEEYWVDCDIPWVTVEDIRKHGQYNLQPLNETVQHISQIGLDNSAAVLHPAGTVMLSRTASIGLSCITAVDMATTQAFVTWTTNKSLLEPRYLHAVLKALEEQFYYLAYGATHLTIYFPDIKTLKIPLPTMEEQILIADFLEVESLKIDSLINEQEKLIDLLGEKNQALIGQFISKGLNPDAALKDSGESWIGQIPNFWELKKLKYCVELIQEKTQAKDNVIALENIESWTGRYIETNSEFEGDGVSFIKNDVLFGKLRPYLAKVFLATDDGQAFGDLLIFRASTSMTPEFLFKLLLNKNFIDLVNSSTYGAKMPRASWDFIGNIKIPLPSTEEQEEIVKKINSEQTSIEKFIKVATRSIELLKERRASLISEAVTGKIDVRELA